MCICAVVVSYHPGAEIIENVTALLDQVDEVVIVDNGSGAETKELLDKLNSYPKVNIIYNEENLGIAEALNIGVKHTKAAGHQWVATFDQDSRVAPGMIRMMQSAYDAYPEKEKVAILTPRYKDKTTGCVTRNASEKVDFNKEPLSEMLIAITSGNLVKLSVFDAVGYFNKALFIDYVDIEFCLRCRLHDYKILEVYDAVLEHSLGSPTQHKFFGKISTSTNHSGLRRYYIARNRIYVYKQFAIAYPIWVSMDVYVFLKEITKLMLFERDRRTKLAAICRGIFHGFVGRMGKL